MKSDRTDRRAITRAASRRAVGFVVAVATAVACWSLDYWLTAAVFPVVGLRPQTYLFELLRLVVFILLYIGSLRSVAKALGLDQNDYVLRIRDAMERIASGDYGVSLPIEGGSIVSRLSRSLNEMSGSLKRVEEMRQEFISNVSHEIQSPLTSIVGFAKALRTDALTAEQRSHYLSVIEAEGGRLSRLSESLLRLSSLDSSAQQLEPRPLRLDSQLRNVILAAEPQWSGKEIDVSAELAPVTVVGDASLLLQVWNNLLHNAVKFTPRGGRIAVDLSEENGTVEVQFADNGIGVAEGDIPYLFDRFYKADRARPSDGGNAGSGLGLSIVAKIVHLHGGTVEADSEGIGKGARFRVTLPIDGPGSRELGAPRPPKG